MWNFIEAKIQTDSYHAEVIEHPSDIEDYKDEHEPSLVPKEAPMFFSGHEICGGKVYNLQNLMKSFLRKTHSY